MGSRPVLLLAALRVAIAISTASACLFAAGNSGLLLRGGIARGNSNVLVGALIYLRGRARYARKCPKIATKYVGYSAPKFL